MVGDSALQAGGLPSTDCFLLVRQPSGTSSTGHRRLWEGERPGLGVRADLQSRWQQGAPRAARAL
eukprot:9349828-Heterocapsa_arctica.AAC.1